jgi:hypothetical protein
MTHPSLESCHLVIRERIGLGDHGNQIDLGMQTSHKLDIEGFQARFAGRPFSPSSRLAPAKCWEGDLRMTGRLDKVDTCVNPVVDQLCPVDPVLLFEVSIEPSLDVVDDRFPAADDGTEWY